jgi:NAD(P)-dependent dehydrogenase (short-subunit alcohol dehydrogenase family)
MKRTILITGGAKRIGAAITKHFAQKKYNIIINYLHSEVEALTLSKYINESGAVSVPYKANVTNCNEMSALFEFAKNEFGSIDVVVNNAGVFPPKKTLAKLKFSEYLATLNLNMHSAMITTKEFIKQNISDGRIINISSIGGIDIFNNCIDYNVSKAGLIRLTQVLAKELAPKISVNCICPGIVKVNNEDIDFSIEKIPMRRFATTEDIVEAIDFFVIGPKYITGQILNVSGGMEL